MADTLLGAEVERLETVGKMLRVARTPKLGESLNASFVTEKLRDALPGLERGEVEALAEGWDQLDRARRDLTLARENVEALRAFVNQAWVPYARARLRQGADAAAAARSAFDGVTRRVRESTEAFATAEAEVSRLDTEITEAQARAMQARDQREAHLRSRAYRRRSRPRPEPRPRPSSGRPGRGRPSMPLKPTSADTRRRSPRSADELTTAQGQATLRETELEDFVAALLGPASGAGGLRSAKDLQRSGTGPGSAVHLEPHRLPRPPRGTRPRLSAAGRNGAECRGAVRGAARGTAETTAHEAEAAWTAAEDERGRLATAIAAWAGALDVAIRPDGTATWTAGWPPCQSRRRHRPTLRRASGRTGYGHSSTNTPVGASEPSCTATGWRPSARPSSRRSRRCGPRPSRSCPNRPSGAGRRVPVRAGAPFWSLVDPRPGVAAALLARVEAALAAMGILDAWVTPQGIRGADRTVADLLLTPTVAPAEGMSLTEVLTVGSAHDALSGVVEGALAAIARRALRRHGRGRAPPSIGRLLRGLVDHTDAVRPCRPPPRRPSSSASRPARPLGSGGSMPCTAQITDLDTTIEAERAAMRLTPMTDEERLQATFALLPSDGELLRQLSRRQALGAAADRQSQDADAAEAPSPPHGGPRPMQRGRPSSTTRGSTPSRCDPEARSVVSRSLAEVARVASPRSRPGNAQPPRGCSRRPPAAAGRRHAAAEARLEESRAARADAERVLRQAEATESALRAAIDDDDAEVLARADRLRR